MKESLRKFSRNCNIYAKLKKLKFGGNVLTETKLPYLLRSYCGLRRKNSGCNSINQQQEVTHRRGEQGSNARDLLVVLRENVKE